MTLIHREITETGEIIDRPFTADEIAEVELTEKQRLIYQAEMDSQAKKKAALLEKLGITSEEARLLLS